MTRQDYDTLCARLEAAVQALEARDCYLQAIARKYYVVYTVAKYASVLHGVWATHTRAGRTFQSQDFHHNEMPDVIRCLYTGLKRGFVTDSGDCTGITGATLTDGDAWRIVETLQNDRKLADYGPGTVQEPHSPAKAKERLNKAQILADDLRKLI